MCTLSSAVGSGPGTHRHHKQGHGGYRSTTEYTYLGSNSLRGHATDLLMWTFTHMQVFYSGMSHAARHMSCHARKGLYCLFGNAQQGQNLMLKRLETAAVDSTITMRPTLMSSIRCLCTCTSKWHPNEVRGSQGGEVILSERSSWRSSCRRRWRRGHTEALKMLPKARGRACCICALWHGVPVEGANGKWPLTERF